MYPEDRVLIGVMSRQSDFELAKTQGWYRVPQAKAPKAHQAAYVAFFFSKDFGPQNGGVYYYAALSGHELTTRADLLPGEAHHPKAKEAYYKLQFRELQAKLPPLLNPRKRRFAFIYSTWDRFVAAKSLEDLYSQADHLVDRVYYALRDLGLPVQRRWEAAAQYSIPRAQLRVLCEAGEVLASPYGDEGLALRDNLADNLSAIQTEVQAKGGPRWLQLPAE
jgi:hypothetical protein